MTLQYALRLLPLSVNSVWYCIECFITCVLFVSLLFLYHQWHSDNTVYVIMLWADTLIGPQPWSVSESWFILQIICCQQVGFYAVWLRLWLDDTFLMATWVTIQSVCTVNMTWPKYTQWSNSIVIALLQQGHMNHRHGQSGIVHHLVNKKILLTKYNKLLYVRYMKLWTGAAIMYIFH